MRKLALALLLVATQASAELSVEPGISFFTKNDVEAWYQNEFPHDLRLQVPSIRISYAHPIGDYKFRVGYWYLGKTKSAALASASDEDHSWPLSHWYGEGTNAGYTVGFDTPARKFGGFSVHTEYGIYWFRPRWHEVIPDWRPCKTCAGQLVDVSHFPRRQVTPIIGMVAEKGPLGLTATYLHDVEASKDAVPAIYAPPTKEFGWRRYIKGMMNFGLRYSFN